MDTTNDWLLRHKYTRFRPKHNEINVIFDWFTRQHAASLYMYKHTLHTLLTHKHIIIPKYSWLCNFFLCFAVLCPNETINLVWDTFSFDSPHFFFDFIQKGYCVRCRVLDYTFVMRGTLFFIFFEQNDSDYIAKANELFLGVN